MKRCVVVFGCLVASALLAMAAAAADCTAHTATPLSYGVPPWLGSAIAEHWSRQVGQHLHQHACIETSFRSDRDYASYLQSALRGKYDVMDMPPHMASYLAQRHGFLLLVSDRFEQGTMALFVRPDSSIRQLSDIHGKTVALPDPLAIVSLATEQLLAEQHIIANFRFFGRHDRVVTAVASGRADVGAVFSPILDSYHERAHSALRLLARQLPLQGWLVARPDLDPALQARLTTALGNFPGGQSALLPSWTAISAADVEQLHRDMLGYVELLEQRLAAPNPVETEP